MSGSKRRDSPSSLVEETAMTVLITRLELTPEDLRREAGRTKDAGHVRQCGVDCWCIGSADWPFDAGELESEGRHV
jgi:hypothetical protein